MRLQFYFDVDLAEVFVFSYQCSQITVVFGLPHGQSPRPVDQDQRDDALRWLARFGNPYQLSAYDIEGRVGINYGVYGVPETYVIDKAGVIRMKHTGPITPEILGKKIMPLLAELNK